MRLTRPPLAAAILLSLAASAPLEAQQSRPPYKDPRQPVERRVEDLLARMTLEEKVAQLLTLWEQKAKVQTREGRFSADMASRSFSNGIGGFARPSDKRGVTAGNNAAGYMTTGLLIAFIGLLYWYAPFHQTVDRATSTRIEASPSGLELKSPQLPATSRARERK